MTVNEITAARVELALDLTAANIKVLEYIPERVTPPIVIMQAGAPYINLVTIDTQYDLNIELIAVSSNQTNAKASENLDALIEKVLNGLPDYAKFESVGQPYYLSANNAEYLAATVFIKIRITI